MSLYRPKGSAVWVMDFAFRGQRIRESTGVTSISRAKKICDKRRRDLEDGTAGIRKRKDPGLLSVAAKEWQESRKPKWAPRTGEIVEGALGHMLPVIGKMLVVDIEPHHVAKYQRVRLAESASNRTVNIEVSILRQIMRKNGVWARIQSDITMLRERQDVGHALTAAEESILLLECGRSRSRILLPFVVLSLETGARYNTIRTLRWSNVDLINRYLKFGKDKTEAGTGRTVPLNKRALEVLQFWAQQFPNRIPSHFVFPLEQYGGAGRDNEFGFTSRVVLSTDPKQPVGAIKSAWQAAKKRTRRHCPSCKNGTLVDQQKPATGHFCVDCQFVTAELPAGLATLRLHDLRHSAVSRMIAAGIPLPIIAKIVGWSASTMAKMAARYGHFGIEELRGAVEAISLKGSHDSAVIVRTPPGRQDERRLPQ
jgi:integrase